MISRQLIQLCIDIFGWLYFVIWSVSFYPQVFLLFKQKSAMGMSANYIFINLTGYAMYSVYNLYGYFKGNNSQTGLVDRSDILFSMHSVFVYGLIVILFFYYPHKIQLSPWTILYLIIQWTVFLYYGYYSLIATKPIKISIFGYKTSLGYFETLGYFKMFSTLLKHPPQIYFNFKRKSTRGWSIQSMIMDFLGGFFSLLALILQNYLHPKYTVNKAKLFLSIMSMIYDTTYMVQHYILYKNNNNFTEISVKKIQIPQQGTKMPSDQQQTKNILQKPNQKK